MNVSTITMDPNLAAQKLKAFRSNLHKDSEEVYRETANAYEQLAKGTPLLRLSMAIQQAGRFPDERPRLAIARADRKEVYFRWHANRRDAFYHSSNRFDARCNTPSLRIDVDMGLPNPAFSVGNKGQRYSKDVEGYSLVPMVPADVRPKHGQLKDWFVLWEVEQWADRPHGSHVDPDPLLLKHLGGDLYAVLAQWDLTEIERAILSQVRS